MGQAEKQASDSTVCRQHPLSLTIEPLATVPRWCGQSQNERKECALLEEREIQKGPSKVTCEENLKNKKVKKITGRHRLYNQPKSILKKI